MELLQERFVLPDDTPCLIHTYSGEVAWNVVGGLPLPQGHNAGPSRVVHL